MYRKENREKWQKTFIKEVFKNDDNGRQNYSSIILNNLDLLKIKDEYLPATLYKFYAPTSDNILDIVNKRLWLSHPASFNDPFDCHTGYDSLEYEKYFLLNFIKCNGIVDENESQEGFSIKEFERISRSSTSLKYHTYYSRKEDYYDIVRKLLEQKSRDFQQKVLQLLRDSLVQLESNMDKLRDINIRVACFSGLEKYIEFYKKNQMWSHYSENHKGFCVEYDISSLKEDTVFKFENYLFHSETDNYMNERIRATIKGGLFPVIYTSNRVNIPVTKLMKIKDHNSSVNIKNGIHEIIYKTFIVKSTNWSYEKEWRIILDGNICDYYENKIPFPYISKIFLGCKMDKKTVNTMTEIGDKLGVEVVIMKMDGNKFLLENSYTNNKWDKEILKWSNPFTK